MTTQDDGGSVFPTTTTVMTQSALSPTHVYDVKTEHPGLSPAGLLRGEGARGITGSE